MLDCFGIVKSQLQNTILESRMDPAFFNQDILSMLSDNAVKFTASVPFERFTELKSIIEKRENWQNIDKQWPFFETNWKPKSWSTAFRFIFIRKKNKKQCKGPSHLHLLEARDFEYNYKVIVTSPLKVVLFFSISDQPSS